MEACSYFRNSGMFLSSQSEGCCDSPYASSPRKRLPCAAVAQGSLPSVVIVKRETQ